VSGPAFALEELTMLPTVVITVQEGDRISQEVRFEGGKAACIVGRSRDCQLRLPCDGSHFNVSRRHCQLDIEPPAAWVSDLGSLNGTFLNGRCIGMRGQGDDTMSSARHRLLPGDVIRLGNTLLRYDVVAEDAPNAAADKTELCEACSV
jgi:pSer/pThr/pTyr-binding forkhead associated (FHA) protein